MVAATQKPLAALTSRRSTVDTIDAELAATGPRFSPTLRGFGEPFDDGIQPSMDVQEDMTRSEEAAEFVLESQLETFLISNWHVIKWRRVTSLLGKQFSGVTTTDTPRHV